MVASGSAMTAATASANSVPPGDALRSCRHSDDRSAAPEAFLPPCVSSVMAALGARNGPERQGKSGKFASSLACPRPDDPSHRSRTAVRIRHASGTAAAAVTAII